MTKFKYESSTYMFAMGVIGFEEQSKQKKRLCLQLKKIKTKGIKRKLKHKESPAYLSWTKWRRFPFFLFFFVVLYIWHRNKVVNTVKVTTVVKKVQNNKTHDVFSCLFYVNCLLFSVKVCLKHIYKGVETLPIYFG